MCHLQKHGDLFILTITGDDDHRLNPTLIDSICTALNHAKSQSDSTRPAALITTAQGKFFSNGYDLSWALSNPTRSKSRPKILSKKLWLLVADLISLLMPTIAAVNGHASAAGLILALSHDYLLMNKARGFLYLNELDIRYKIPNWFMQILKHKIASPKIWRNAVLRAEKITAAVGVNWGIVDSAHESVEGTVDAAVKLGAELVCRNWDDEVYASNRRTVFSDMLTALASDETVGDLGDDGVGSESKGVSKMRFRGILMLNI